MDKADRKHLLIIDFRHYSVYRVTKQTNGQTLPNVLSSCYVANKYFNQESCIKHLTIKGEMSVCLFARYLLQRLQTDLHQTCILGNLKDATDGWKCYISVSLWEVRVSWEPHWQCASTI